MTNVQGGLTCSGGLCSGVCSAGFVSCSQPTAPSSDDGCECAAPACCGSTCPARHSNCLGPTCAALGLGQAWFDANVFDQPSLPDYCRPLGTPGNPSTYTKNMAGAARSAYPASGTSYVYTCTASSSAENARAKETATQCIVWVWGGTLAGYLRVTAGPCGLAASMCPSSTAFPTWN